MYILKYFFEATLVVKMDIIALLALSVVIWAAFLNKFNKMRLMFNYADSFEKSFWSGVTLEEFYNTNKANISHPLGVIFGGAMEEWNTSQSNKSNNLSDFEKMSLRDRIYDSIEYSKIKITNVTGQYQALFLTISSVAPFMGLFGTICGIINTFYNISITGNASITTIAPGVAEALITTAFSIIVALTSGVMYNIFNIYITKLNYRVDCFAIDIINILSREMDKVPAIIQTQQQAEPPENWKNNNSNSTQQTEATYAEEDI